MISLEIDLSIVRPLLPREKAVAPEGAEMAVYYPSLVTWFFARHNKKGEVVNIQFGQGPIATPVQNKPSHKSLNSLFRDTDWQISE